MCVCFTFSKPIYVPHRINLIKIPTLPHDTIVITLEFDDSSYNFRKRVYMKKLNLNGSTT